MQEIWKTIEGTDGRYEVSNTGKIRSLNYKRSRKIKELRPAPDPKGYMKTMILIDGRYKTVKLHRLVAEAFISNPDNRPQVNHKDGNKSNNSVGNLEWAYNIDNAHHAIDNGLFVNSYMATAAANEKRKKPVIAIGADGTQRVFDSINEASRTLGVGRRHIQSILRGERHQTGGYTFESHNEGVMP